MIARLDSVSLSSILTEIAADLRDILPKEEPFEPFCYVFEALGCYTLRVIFEFVCIASENSKKHTPAVMLGEYFLICHC